MNQISIHKAADLLSVASIIASAVYALLYLLAFVGYSGIKHYIWGDQGASYGEDFIPVSPVILASVRAVILILLAVLLKKRRGGITAEMICLTGVLLLMVIPVDSLFIFHMNSVYYTCDTAREYIHIHEFALANEVFQCVTFAAHISYAALLIGATASLTAKKCGNS